MSTLLPRYPFPLLLVAHLCSAILLNRQRSFKADAQACVGRLRPPLQIIGQEHIPNNGPVLITTNHYSRPGFPAWWLALAISAALPAEVHWVITTAWTFPGRPGARHLSKVSSWLLARLARVYDFTCMPPMPPRPQETEARALAVRQVLAYVRRASPKLSSGLGPLVGLAPEGQDHPDGQLHMPPPGVGRFIIHLARSGLVILPVGIYEENSLCLRFGQSYCLEIPPDLDPGERDDFASRIVINHIAALLPASISLTTDDH